VSLRKTILQKSLGQKPFCLYSPFRPRISRADGDLTMTTKTIRTERAVSQGTDAGVTATSFIPATQAAGERYDAQRTTLNNPTTRRTVGSFAPLSR
jgi:hypothetical protein